MFYLAFAYNRFLFSPIGYDQDKTPDFPDWPVWNMQGSNDERLSSWHEIDWQKPSKLKTLQDGFCFLHGKPQPDVTYEQLHHFDLFDLPALETLQSFIHKLGQSFEWCIFPWRGETPNNEAPVLGFISSDIDRRDEFINRFANPLKLRERGRQSIPMLISEYNWPNKDIPLFRAMFFRNKVNDAETVWNGLNLAKGVPYVVMLNHDDDYFGAAIDRSGNFENLGHLCSVTSPSVCDCEKGIDRGSEYFLYRVHDLRTLTNFCDEYNDNGHMVILPSSVERTKVQEVVRILTNKDSPLFLETKLLNILDLTSWVYFPKCHDEEWNVSEVFARDSKLLRQIENSANGAKLLTCF